MIRCYNDLIQLKTFEERFQYLKINGKVVGSGVGKSKKNAEQQAAYMALKNYK